MVASLHSDGRGQGRRWTGCYHPDRTRVPARRFRSATVAAHLVREILNVDRLLEQNRRNRRARSQGASPSSASELNATTGIADVRAPVRESPGRVRAVHVRQPDVHQDHSPEAAPAASAIPSAPLAGFERPEPGGEQHVPGELQVPRVVVDDQDERALLEAKPGTVVSFDPCRSGSCSPTTTTSFARACRRLLETEPDIDVVAVCSDLESLLDAVDAATSGRRRHRHPHAARQAPTRGSRRPRRLRETHPTIGVVVLSQYASAELRSRAPRARQRGPRLPPEGARRGSSTSSVAAIRAVAEGGSVIDPEGRGGAGGGEQAAARTRRSTS